MLNRIVNANLHATSHIQNRYGQCYDDKQQHNNRHMKIKILLTILTFPMLLFGQVTSHFNNLDSKWNVAKTYQNANMQNPNFVATTTTVYGFQGDTLINSDLWFKLYSTSD